MPSFLRYAMARLPIQDSKTALVASSSCLYTSCGKSNLTCFLNASLNVETSACQSSAVISVSSLYPLFFLYSAIGCSKISSSRLKTVVPNISIRRRYESQAKPGFPVSLVRPSTTSSFKPMFRTVFIMPGMENLAPERQETSSGFFGSPNFLPVAFSTFFIAATCCSHCPAGNFPVLRNSLQASVVTVNPGGTGTPARVISKSPAPLPPSRERTPSQEPAYFSAAATSPKR